MVDDKIIQEAEQILRECKWRGTYILDGRTAIPCYDTLEWGRWMQKADRHVADTTTTNGRVSTVFLGLDYDFTRKGRPLLFETMVFGGIFSGDTQRYSTWTEAEEGHVRKVRYVTELR